MGYRCPVCGAPHTDGVHLANHLAFTALMRGGTHGAWLEENASDWRGQTPETLAEQIAPHADETELDPVTEERANHDPPNRPVPGGSVPDRASDGVVERVVREARDLTERMRGNENPSGK